MNDLEVGGLLITEIAMYRKKTEDSLAIDKINETAFAIGLSDMQIEREIIKMKITSKKINIRFIDNRPSKWN